MSRMRIQMALAIAACTASPAFAGHAQFVGRRSEVTVTFVPAYAECMEPTTTHRPPLTFPACPASRVSNDLGFGGRGWGRAHMKATMNAANQATDVLISVDLYDVRQDGGTGTPFDGSLTLSANARSTDDFCPVGDIPCTMTDLPGVLPFITVFVPCGAAASPPLPSGRCHAAVSANEILPGAVIPGADANVEIGTLQIYRNGILQFVQGMLLL